MQLSRKHTFHVVHPHPLIMCHDAGELEAETAALLEMEKVSDVDFTPAVLACLPKEDEAWSISPQERACRRDFTSTRYADTCDMGAMEMG